MEASNYSANQNAGTIKMLPPGEEGHLLNENTGFLDNKYHMK